MAYTHSFNIYELQKKTITTNDKRNYLKTVQDYETIPGYYYTDTVEYNIKTGKKIPALVGYVPDYTKGAEMRDEQVWVPPSERAIWKQVSHTETVYNERVSFQLRPHSNKTHTIQFLYYGELRDKVIKQVLEKKSRESVRKLLIKIHEIDDSSKDDAAKKGDLIKCMIQKKHFKFLDNGLKRELVQTGVGVLGYSIRANIPVAQTQRNLHWSSVGTLTEVVSKKATASMIYWNANKEHVEYLPDQLIGTDNNEWSTALSAIKSKETSMHSGKNKKLEQLINRNFGNKDYFITMKSEKISELMDYLREYKVKRRAEGKSKAPYSSRFFGWSMDDKIDAADRLLNRLAAHQRTPQGRIITINLPIKLAPILENGRLHENIKEHAQLLTM